MSVLTTKVNRPLFLLGMSLAYIGHVVAATGAWMAAKAVRKEVKAWRRS